MAINAFPSRISLNLNQTVSHPGKSLTSKYNAQKEFFFFFFFFFF